MDNRPDSEADPLPDDPEFVVAEPVLASRSGPVQSDNGRSKNDVLPEANSVPVAGPIDSGPTGDPDRESAEYLANDSGFRRVTPLDPDSPEEALRRQTAVAGSVTSVFLGVWSIIFSFFTGLAIINALIGIGFAVWGLTSTRSSLAILGLALCATGFLMTMIFVSR